MVYLKAVQLILILSVTSASALKNSLPEDDILIHGSRIVGGNSARTFVPYQISVQISNSNNFDHICGGVIISADFFLTAAHCVDRIDKSRLSAVAGVIDLTFPSGSRHQVQAYIVHENYLVEGVNNIAIAKVITPFVLNGASIAAINFNSTDEVGSGVPVYLTGWGAIDIFAIFYPNILKILSATTISNVECQNTYVFINASEICTKRSVFRGACKRDAGGPVTNLQKTLLIGLISLGPQPCADGLPDIHTRISEFVDWITDKMNQVWP